MRKVLHVSESFGGGVATAISEYRRSAPEIEHVILYGNRSEVTPDSFEGFDATYTLPGGAASIARIREVCHEVRPDLVHVHSSWAGVSVRVALWSRKVPIVYTPHCFAFHRRDVNPVVTWAFWMVERVLALNTTVLAGCSPVEAAIGSRWLGEDRAVFVPNIARVDGVQVPERKLRRVVALGRLSPQKDPTWFADMVEFLPDGVEKIWIGDGDERYRTRLQQAGVRVTGWLPRAEALDLIASARVHVLSSLWEGFPMAILEAHACQVAGVVRGMPSVPETPAEETFVDAADAAARVLQLLDDDNEWEANLARWHSILGINTPAGQRERLLAAYSSALSVRPVTSH